MLTATVLTATDLATLPLIAAWLVARRAWFPRLRRRCPVGLVVNTSVRRTYDCALCGARCSQANFVMVVASRGRHAGSKVTILCAPTQRVCDFFAAHSTLEHLMAHAADRQVRSAQAAALRAAQVAQALDARPRCRHCDNVVDVGDTHPDCADWAAQGRVGGEPPRLRSIAAVGAVNNS